jgi:diguanylate cyclase (GGDEF)-like protein/PAS domain S-box-containing protein
MEPRSLPSHRAEEPTPDSESEADRLGRELDDLRDRLADSEEALRAIRYGEVDALVVAADSGHERVFTLASADRPYRNFVENMSDGAATVSSDGIVTYANQALADMVGSSCQQIVGQPVIELVSPGSSRARLEKVVAPSGAGGSIEATVLTSGGDRVPVRIGSSSALSINSEDVTCITVTDLTAERKAEAELAHSAQHDTLTGLANRSLLADRIEHALERRATGKSLMALLFCDIDGFKGVNDAYGHQTGDDLLRIIAQRLSSAVRPEDTVARMGGDEFVVLCEGLGDLTDAAAVASRARAAVAAPITIGPSEFEVTISIGVSVASANDDASPDTLLRDADEAMYKAKRQGPNVVEMFDEQLRTVTTSRLRLLSEMRHAAVDGELRLHYQPVVSLEDETIVGVEALVRWQHPRHGLVPPDEFIPFAEHSGLITEIGGWVMAEACRQAAQWTGDRLPGRRLLMSVNISGRQLAQGAGLVESVRAALTDSSVDPTGLVLEVTESALMDDAEAALRSLEELKSLGVRIAIDDFGIGYSSLAYLKRFPVDLLKVDRSFVAGLGQNQDDAAIVHSVIELAHAFGIDAVAEGIENRRHLAILQDLGCAFGQGYLWSPALPAAELSPRLLMGPNEQVNGIRQLS